MVENFSKMITWKFKNMKTSEKIKEIAFNQIKKEKQELIKSLDYRVKKISVYLDNQPVYRDINILDTKLNNSLRIWITSEGLIHFAIIGSAAKDGQWEELFINKPSIGKKIFDLVGKFYAD